MLTRKDFNKAVESLRKANIKEPYVYLTAAGIKTEKEALDAGYTLIVDRP